MLIAIPIYSDAVLIIKQPNSAHDKSCDLFSYIHMVQV